MALRHSESTSRLLRAGMEGVMSRESDAVEDAKARMLVMEEPQNVRIARIMGWTGVHRTGDRPQDWYGWDPENSEHGEYDRISDYANDAAFILGMIEKNGLSVYRSAVNGWVRWFSTRPDGGRAEDGPYGEGSNVRDSVLAWIEAAHAAGVEIQR